MKEMGEYNNFRSKCPFCDIIHNKADIIKNPENTILFSTKNFIIIPDAAPIVPGHVLVISRNHYFGFARMNYQLISEYESLKNKVFSIKPFQHLDYIEIEHGSTTEDAAGACIVHAHIHLIPQISKLFPFILKELPVIENKKRMIDLIGENRPYIFVRSTNSDVQCYVAKDLQSQFMRKRICEKMNLDFVNTPDYNRNDWIKETIKFWRENIDND